MGLKVPPECRSSLSIPPPACMSVTQRTSSFFRLIFGFFRFRRNSTEPHADHLYHLTAGGLCQLGSDLPGKARSGFQHLALDEFPGGERVVHLLDRDSPKFPLCPPAEWSRHCLPDCADRLSACLSASVILLFHWGLSPGSRRFPPGVRSPPPSAGALCPGGLIRSFSSSLYSAKLRSPI